MCDKLQNREREDLQNYFQVSFSSQHIRGVRVGVGSCARMQDMLMLSVFLDRRRRKCRITSNSGDIRFYSYGNYICIGGEFKKLPLHEHEFDFRCVAAMWRGWRRVEASHQLAVEVGLEAREVWLESCGLVARVPQVTVTTGTPAKPYRKRWSRQHTQLAWRESQTRNR